MVGHLPQFIGTVRIRTSITPFINAYNVRHPCRMINSLHWSLPKEAAGTGPLFVRWPVFVSELLGEASN